MSDKINAFSQLDFVEQKKVHQIWSAYNNGNQDNSFIFGNGLTWLNYYNEKKKVFVLLPDGVGLRNFVYSNFYEIGKQEYDIVFWNNTPLI